MNKTVSTLLLLSGLTLAGSVSAATIAGSVVSYTTKDNLSTVGTSDWAYWDTSENPATGAPTNSKSGSDIISSIFRVGGDATVRGSSTPSTADFSYGADGTSGLSGDVNNVSGIFNTATNTNDSGVGLTITLPTTDTYLINIYVGVYSGPLTNDNNGAFSAALTGATTYSDSSTKGEVSNGKHSFVYTLEVTPDSANQDLTINYTLNRPSSQSNSHVLISGAAVKVIPEPTSLALLSLGGLLAFRRKR